MGNQTRRKFLNPYVAWVPIVLLVAIGVFSTLGIGLGRAEDFHFEMDANGCSTSEVEFLEAEVREALSDIAEEYRGWWKWQIPSSVDLKKITIHPRVRSVSIGCSDHVECIVRAQLRRPVAVVAGEKNFFLDEESVLFQEVFSDEPVDLPIISGWSLNSFYEKDELLRSLTSLLESYRLSLKKFGKILELGRDESGLVRLGFENGLHLRAQPKDLASFPNLWRESNAESALRSCVQEVLAEEEFSNRKVLVDWDASKQLCVRWFPGPRTP